MFTNALDYVDINITRAVQASQLPSLQGYHRRIFFNKNDATYLIWDFVNAMSDSDCSQATYNLHVITQLGWPGVSGCETMDSTSAAYKLICHGLNDIALDVSILRPANAEKRGLLHIEADPLPVQFTGMTGSVGSALSKPQVGGVLGGDWNAAGNVAPKDPYFKARTPTWIRINAHEQQTTKTNENQQCFGFITLLQPRSKSKDSVAIDRFEELDSGSATILTVTKEGGTLYLLGRQEKEKEVKENVDELYGVAGVVGWSGQDPQSIDHVTLIEGCFLSVPNSNLMVSLSQNVTLSIVLQSPEQYILTVHSPIVSPTIVTIQLPWKSPPKQVNVWRGSHVWHVTNTSLDVGEMNPTIRFEALPGLEYLIERLCVRSIKAGYNDGKGGWLCDPEHPYNEGEL